MAASSRSKASPASSGISIRRRYVLASAPLSRWPAITRANCDNAPATTDAMVRMPAIVTGQSNLPNHGISLQASAASMTSRNQAARSTKSNPLIALVPVSHSRAQPEKDPGSRGHIRRSPDLAPKAHQAAVAERVSICAKATMARFVAADQRRFASSKSVAKSTCSPESISGRLRSSRMFAASGPRVISRAALLRLVAASTAASSPNFGAWIDCRAAVLVGWDEH
jgi:hypothetical protein